MHLGEVAGRQVGHPPARLDAAGEADEVDARVGDETLADRPPPPRTTFSTPSGRPQSPRMRARLTVEITAAVGGLTTIEQPAASAAARRWLPVISGPFQGMSSATTPAGSRSRSVRISGPPPGMRSGGKLVRLTSPWRSRQTPAA